MSHYATIAACRFLTRCATRLNSLPTSSAMRSPRPRCLPACAQRPPAGSTRSTCSDGEPEPLTDPADPRTQWEQQAADLHFLLVSLTRLRKAVESSPPPAAPLCAQLEALLADFDRRTEYLRRMRNVGEHFDDYTIGKGRDKQVGRAQLQTWNLTIEEVAASLEMGGKGGQTDRGRCSGYRSLPGLRCCGRQLPRHAGG